MLGSLEVGRPARWSGNRRIREFPSPSVPLRLEKYSRCLSVPSSFKFPVPSLGKNMKHWPDPLQNLVEENKDKMMEVWNEHFNH